ncbi:hypothetical protein SSP24_83320 [Streptomyces spinoverrucosus]|uniref:Uncharacterized protein n=1 Tax=Streptomyces spinoverrucosus TaxID=284043 RepID=A0A4Y3VUX8_9ACTN|nr:hypothetical protein SSP24_83320 [Streptomyces spinoverrucosus]GHB99358.1 hypothetical protein GCM10010397_84470 [Streptomyces spinoverrucosus]
MGRACGPIVLGESITAATLAVRTALDAEASLGSILVLALGGVLTVFALWWLYFAQDAPRHLASMTTAMLWGYGHYAVFASAAAVGTGRSGTGVPGVASWRGVPLLWCRPISPLPDRS